MTTEPKHTPESTPWRVIARPGGKTFDIVNGLGGLIAQTSYEDRARRIVACVNACAGIGTETLLHCKFEGDWQVAKQRDALAEALDRITREDIHTPNGTYRDALNRAKETARAALAKAQS